MTFRKFGNYTLNMDSVKAIQRVDIPAMRSLLPPFKVRPCEISFLVHFIDGGHLLRVFESEDTEAIEAMLKWTEWGDGDEL